MRAMSPLTHEIARADVDRIIEAAKRWGATVSEDWNEPAGGRFIGTFDGHHITLFPKYDSNLAIYFTTAHLYGHMVQHALSTPAAQRAEALLAAPGKQFKTHEVQILYAHEQEAAAIGRTLMADAGPVSRELDGEYSRLFLADFHYLVNFYETTEAGPAAFERYWRREPVPYALIGPDPRPLVDLRKYPAKPVPVAVV